MNEFVDQCRREWKRLGVPTSVADEMAAELATDLDEGGSPEDVLGQDAADARAFARTWAAARGAVPERRTRRLRSWLPAALAVVALVPTVVGAVLTAQARSKTARVALPEPTTVTLSLPRNGRGAVWVVDAHAAAEQARLVSIVATTQQPGDDDTHTLGVGLLICGLSILGPLTLHWLLQRVGFGR